MLQDWQVDVQSGVAASTTTFLSKSGSTLKDFIENLDVNTTALDARYLLASSYPNLGDIYSSIDGDEDNLLDTVSLTADGASASFSRTGRTGELSLTTDNFNAVETTALTSGDEAEGLYEDGKTVGLRRYKRLRKIFSAGGAYPSGQEVALTVLDTLVACPFKNAPTYDSNRVYNVSTANGTFHVSETGVYTFSVSIGLRPTVLGSNPHADTDFQLILSAANPGGTGTYVAITEHMFKNRRIGTNYIELITTTPGIFLAAGGKVSLYMAERTNSVGGNTNKMELWVLGATAYIED